MVDTGKNEDDDLTSPKNTSSPIIDDTKNLSHDHSIIIEHEMTVAHVLRNYRPAVFWSIMVCMCTVMEGYDTILIPNFFAYPAFAQKYGSFDAGSGTYQLNVVWQIALGTSATVGAFLGIIANGYLSSWYGPKKVLLGALVALSFFISITFVAPTVEVLYIGELLCGLPWGIFASTAPAYSSEIIPLPLRGYLTTYTNMCFIIGQLTAAGVLESLLFVKGSWSYRGAFVLQWAWPAFIFPILLFMPESPWHFVRSGDLEQARESLKRLQSKSAPTDVNERLEVISRTNAMEKSISSGTSYLACFRGTELRRTEIACMAFAGQMFSGLSFASNSTYFYQQIGLSPKESYRLNLGGTGISLCATLFSWFFIMPYVGRRKIYLCGMISATILLFLMGSLNVKASQRPFAMAQVAITLIWTFIFQLSIGQLGWAIPAEIGSTRLRQKTVCLARNSYYLIDFFAKIIEPYFMNPMQLNLKGYTGFFWGITAFMTSVWTFFRLPETKGRTYEELDILFAKRVPANQFSSYNIVAPLGIQKNRADGLEP